MKIEDRKEDLWNKELLTQKEVASIFGVVSGTVKNWREQGGISFWQAPFSSRVLFRTDDIKDIYDKYYFSKKGEDKPKAEIKKVKPSLSSEIKEWKI